MSSWITDLADKAENILIKIDQNAATALQNSTETVPSSLDVVKKNLTSSTQSLKIALSPVKKLSDSDKTVIDNNAVANNELWKQEITTEDESAHEMRLASNTIMNLNAQELTTFKTSLSEVTAERDELRLRLFQLSNDDENTNLKRRELELQQQLQHLTEEHESLQISLNEVQNTNTSYALTISELETNVAKLQQEYINIAQKLQLQVKETEQRCTELAEYRTKAQRALQAKDTLIAELKANSNATNNSTNENEKRLLQIEYDALKQELEHSIGDQQKLHLRLKEVLVLERRNAIELAAAHAREENLNIELRTAREHSITAESEQRVLCQELDTLRQQLSNHMAMYTTRLQEKEQQLEKLRNEKHANINEIKNGSSKDEYENRLQTLTQSLVERQDTLERITAERNALRLQLEKVQLEVQQLNHRIDIESQRNAPRNNLLLNSTDDVKAQYPLLMHPNPFDNRVARRVKRAYSSLDSAGIRLGAFLRRYPLMRIGVLVYVALLHIWVMFVLLSTTPN